MKLCPKCNATKSPAQFYKSVVRADGLSSYCRECQINDSKSRYSPHPRWRAPEGQKWCPRCEACKPLETFGANKRTHDGKQNLCKLCAVAAVTASRTKDPTSHRRSSKAWKENNPERAADARVKRTYGLEHGSYAAMFAAQGGACAICGTTDRGPRSRFHIDHCHDTGKVRGLLCSRCNTGIGQFKHDPERIRSAVEYVKAHK